MSLDPVLNFGKVTVSTGYNVSATSIVLSSGDGTKLPQPSTDGAFNLVWWNSTDYPDPSDDPNKEIVRCTARSTDTLTVTRGQESIAATDKGVVLTGKTWKMILAFTKLMRDNIDTHIIATSNIHGTTGSITGQASSLTQGRIPIVSTSGLLADDSNLVWDNTYKTLGIGAPNAVGIINIAKTHTNPDGNAIVIRIPPILTPKTGFDTYGINMFYTAGSSTENIGNAYGIVIASISKGNSGTITNIFGIKIGSQSAVCTNVYGLYVELPTGGVTLNLAALIGTSGVSENLETLRLVGLLKFAGTNTTGAGTASLSTNCPAVTATAPYTWIKAISSDGSTVYIPAWK